MDFAGDLECEMQMGLSHEDWWIVMTREEFLQRIEHSELIAYRCGENAAWAKARVAAYREKWTARPIWFLLGAAAMAVIVALKS